MLHKLPSTATLHSSGNWTTTARRTHSSLPLLNPTPSSISPPATPMFSSWTTSSPRNLISSPYVAARLGHALAVKPLLQQAGPASAAALAGLTNKAASTALREAVRSGKVDVVDRLAEATVLDVESGADEPLIYLAAQVGAVEVVRLLIGSDLQMAQNSSLCGPGGRTALHAAIVHKHFDVASLLVERHPELVTQEDSNKITPLYCAATVGSLKMTKSLLEKDTSTVHKFDSSGRSPIHMATFKGHVPVVGEIYRRCPDSAECLDSRDPIFSI